MRANRLRNRGFNREGDGDRGEMRGERDYEKLSLLSFLIIDIRDLSPVPDIKNILYNIQLQYYIQFEHPTVFFTKYYK